MAIYRPDRRLATLSTLKPQKPVILCAELLKPHIYSTCVFGSLNIEIIIGFRGHGGKDGVRSTEFVKT